VTPTGDVTTLPLPTGAKGVLDGVSVIGSKRNGRLFASDENGLVAIDLSTLHATLYAANALSGRFGAPDALLALSPTEVLFTDSRSHTIRVVHLDAGGSDRAMSVPLVPSLMIDAANNGGDYRDGQASVAMFDAPRGVARSSNGDLIIADTGNRRIRALHGFDARMPESVQTFAHDRLASAGLLTLTGAPSLVDLGLWRTSIAGRLSDEVGHPVAAVAATSERDLVDVTKAAIARRGRAVVWLVQSTGPDDTFASVQGAYREVAPRARQARVALLIAIVPSSIAFPWEGQFGTAIYERNPAFPAVRPVELPAISTRDVRNLYPNFRAVERRSHEPLFGASDGLLTAAGRAVTAGAIAEAVRTSK